MRPAAAAALLLAAAAPTTSDTPWPVTSDTPAYCASLAAKAATWHHPPAEARRLAREGEEMCDHGAIRAGIARLRYALILMHTEHAPPPR